ncbi:MAG: hypothetical protein IT220_05935 [Flavobacteriaceae bacterium]|nr:hypothetical protein [Flavobacteriaceae bacterium]
MANIFIQLGNLFFIAIIIYGYYADYERDPKEFKLSFKIFLKILIGFILLIIAVKFGISHLNNI